MVLLLKNLLFTLIVPGTVAVLLPRIVARGSSPASGAVLGLALLLFGVGGAIYAWCLWDFASFGRGTPAPIDAPKQLVVRGLYRFTRNPMYLAVLTVILGWAVFYTSWNVALYALVVALVFNAFVRLYEEPHLAKVFPDEYAAYCAEVASWLPRLRTKPGA